MNSSELAGNPNQLYREDFPEEEDVRFTAVLVRNRS